MAPPKNAPAQQFQKDEKVLCFHMDMLYEAKVMDVQAAPKPADGYRYKVHYKGWKNTWDDWVLVDRIRPFDDEHKELASQLQTQLRNSLKTSKPLGKTPRGSGVGLGGRGAESGRGSEERGPSGAQGGRGARRGKDWELEQVRNSRIFRNLFCICFAYLYLFLFFSPCPPFLYILPSPLFLRPSLVNSLAHRYLCLTFPVASANSTCSPRLLDRFPHSPFPPLIESLLYRFFRSPLVVSFFFGVCVAELFNRRPFEDHSKSSAAASSRYQSIPNLSFILTLSNSPTFFPRDNQFLFPDYNALGFSRLLFTFCISLFLCIY